MFTVTENRSGVSYLGHGNGNSGPEKGVITKGVFPLEEFLESLKSLESPENGLGFSKPFRISNSLESLENGRILLCFPQSRGSLNLLESLIL